METDVYICTLTRRFVAMLDYLRAMWRQVTLAGHSETCLLHDQAQLLSTILSDAQQ